MDTHPQCRSMTHVKTTDPRSPRTWRHPREKRKKMSHPGTMVSPWHAPAVLAQPVDGISTTANAAIAKALIEHPSATSTVRRPG